MKYLLYILPFLAIGIISACSVDNEKSDDDIIVDTKGENPTADRDDQALFDIKTDIEVSNSFLEENNPKMALKCLEDSEVEWKNSEYFNLLTEQRKKVELVLKGYNDSLQLADSLIILKSRSFLISKEDKFDDVVRHSHKTNKNRLKKSVSIKISEIDGGRPIPSFEIMYYDDDWLFIKEYIIKADDKKFYIEPDNVIRDNSSGKIWEYHIDMIYDGDKFHKMFKEIAKAKEVTIRFRGSKYRDDWTMPENQKLAIDDMIKLYEAKLRKYNKESNN